MKSEKGKTTLLQYDPQEFRTLVLANLVYNDVKTLTILLPINHQFNETKFEIKFMMFLTSGGLPRTLIQS